MGKRKMTKKENKKKDPKWSDSTFDNISIGFAAGQIVKIKEKTK